MAGAPSPPPTTARSSCGTWRRAAPWPRWRATRQGDRLRGAARWPARPLRLQRRTLKLWDLETGRTLATLRATRQGDRLRGAARWPARPLRLRRRHTQAVGPGDGPHLATLKGHSDWVTACAVLPDGRRALSASADRTLKLWDLETGRSWPHSRATRVGDCLAVLPDGRRALSASGDGTLKLWDLETGRPWPRSGPLGRGERLAVLPDGRRALSASADGTLKLWDLEPGRPGHLEGHTTWVNAWRCCPMAGAPSPPPPTARSGCGTWRRAAPCHARRATGLGDALAVLPDGRRALSASADRTLRLWDLETGRSWPRSQGHSDRVTAWRCCPMAGAPSPPPATARSSCGTWRRAAPCATLRGPHGRGDRLAVLPDGRRALSASDDGTLKLWDLETGRTLATLEGHSKRVTACAVLPDGRRALSATATARSSCGTSTPENACKRSTGEEPSLP